MAAEARRRRLGGRVKGSGFPGQGSGSRSGFRVQDLGFRVQRFGFRVRVRDHGAKIRFGMPGMFLVHVPGFRLLCTDVYDWLQLRGEGEEVRGLPAWMSGWQGMDCEKWKRALCEADGGLPHTPFSKVSESKQVSGVSYECEIQILPTSRCQQHRKQKIMGNNTHWW